MMQQGVVDKLVKRFFREHRACVGVPTQDGVVMNKHVLQSTRLLLITSLVITFAGKVRGAEILWQHAAPRSPRSGTSPHSLHPKRRPALAAVLKLRYDHPQSQHDPTLAVADASASRTCSHGEASDDFAWLLAFILCSMLGPELCGLRSVSQRRQCS